MSAIVGTTGDIGPVALTPQPNKRLIMEHMYVGRVESVWRRQCSLLQGLPVGVVDLNRYRDRVVLELLFHHIFNIHDRHV